jgi:hypothetical protein
MTYDEHRRSISNGGTPIWVQPRHRANGVIVAQGTSYIVIGSDEIDELIQAMREISSAPPVTGSSRDMAAQGIIA